MSKLRDIVSNKYILGALKLSLGFVFVVASLGKIIDPQGFARDVYSYVLLPMPLVDAFAAITPWIEFIAGLMLMLDIMPQSMSLIINAMLVMFITAIFVDINRGIEIECGCFDFLFPKEKIGWNTIYRDIIMLVAGTVIMLFDGNPVKMYGLICRKKVEVRKARRYNR
ncbi:MAG: DoxX family membrane protein [Spirochaetia bacterium]|nr:DoxX family membrane protein [Spirochaetia bacterium]